MKTLKRQNCAQRWVTFFLPHRQLRETKVAFPPHFRSDYCKGFCPSIRDSVCPSVHPSICPKLFSKVFHYVLQWVTIYVPLRYLFRLRERTTTMTILYGREKNGKITAAWIWTKFVVSIANGENKYQPKFQLSSSNNLGDMPFFMTEIEDQKGDTFHHLLDENLSLAEIS